MKCLILAAGYATRLYPLTENFPKPLLKIGDKAILDWLIEDIDGAAMVDEYIVISNHKFAEHFQKWAEERPENITVVDDGTSTNETRLGAVCDIRFAIDKLGLSGDFLVVAGDNVLDFSLQKFIRYALQKQSSCVMRYYEPSEEKLRKCGVLLLDPDDRVLEMAEKPAAPKSHWCTPPFYYYTAADAARIPEAIADGCGTDAPGSLAAWMSERSRVYAMEMPGRRYDIGNLQSYEQVKKEFKGIKE